MSKNLRINLYSILVALVVILADQASKMWALENLNRAPMVVIDGFFNLHLAFNTGVAFSMLQFAPETMRWVLTGFAVAVSAALAVWMLKEKHWQIKFGIALMIGGAMGNAIDRIIIGAVVDFLDVYAYSWHWPAFNIADSAICCGVVLMLLETVLGNNKE